MIVDHKKLYEAPSVTVVEVRFWGIVCASEDGYYRLPGYGNVDEI